MGLSKPPQISASQEAEWESFHAWSLEASLAGAAVVERHTLRVRWGNRRFWEIAGTALFDALKNSNPPKEASGWSDLISAIRKAAETSAPCRQEGEYLGNGDQAGGGRFVVSASSRPEGTSDILVELHTPERARGHEPAGGWDLARLERLQAGIAGALSGLIGGQSSAEAARQALAAVGEAAGIDRACFLEAAAGPDDSDPQFTSCIDWTSDRVEEPWRHEFFRQALYGDGLQRWKSVLFAGRPIQGRLADLPEEERQILEAAGLVSVLAVPIVVDGTFRGLIGFEDCQRARKWKESEVSLLYVLAGGLGGALSRGKAHRARWSSEYEQRRIQLDTLIEHAPVGIAVVQISDHRVLLANSAYLNVAAIDAQTPPRESPPCPAASLDLRQKLDEVRIGGRALNMNECQTTDAAGLTQWWNVRLIPLNEGGGAVEVVLIMVVEVTEQVVARQQLAEFAATAESNFSQLEAVINNMTDGVIICAADGRIARMNPAACRIYGCSPDAAPETVNGLRHRLEVFDLTGVPLPLDRFPLTRVLRGGSFTELNLRITHADTGKTWIASFNGTPVRDGDNNVVMAVVTVRDVTESKQHERRLQDWNVTLEQRIMDRTKSLLKYQGQLRDLATELSRAEQRARRHLATELHDYLAQLLVACRMKLGQTRGLVRSKQAERNLHEADGFLSSCLSYTRTLIAELSPAILYEAGLGAAVAWLAEQMRQHDLAVEVRAQGTMEDLPEDEAILVFQAIRELLFNVVKHAETKKAIVTMCRGTEGISITVEDSGKGFNSSDDAKTSTAGGKYGLFSIRERLEALGGWFFIESSPGNGTRATIMIPLHQTSTAAPDEEDALPAPETGSGPKWVAQSIKVLVADDHKIIRSGLRTLLDSYADLRVVGEASNGAEAVEMAGALRPDVVIMDVNMPKMNGIQATRIIRHEYPETVVIGLSVYNDRQIESMMLDAGASILLSKGGPPEELYQALRSKVARL